jgi:tetratricopeptide (TPR) repeat protein
MKEMLRVFGPAMAYTSPGDPAQDILKEGDEYYQQNKFDEAIAKYQELIDNYPESPLVLNALTGMACCYGFKATFGEEDAYYKQIEVMKEIISKYPETEKGVHTYFLIGGVYRELENYDVAIKWFKESIKRYSEKGISTAEALHYLGDTYYKKEDYNMALSTFQKIINEHPDYHFVKGYGIRYLIGCCYEHLGRIDEALEIYKTAIEKGDPNIITDPALIVFRIGKIYEYYKKDYEKAKKWYRKVISDYPDSMWVSEAREALEGFK